MLPPRLSPHKIGCQLRGQNSVLRTIHPDITRLGVQLTLLNWAFISQRDAGINYPDESSVESVNLTMLTHGMACTIQRCLISVLCWLPTRLPVI